VRFRTWPQQGTLIPGRCFQVAVGLSDYRSGFTGLTQPGGSFRAWPPIEDGEYPVAYWEAGTNEVKDGTIAVAGEQASGLPEHAVFVEQRVINETLTFKATRIALNEDAEVEVEGIEFPLDGSGTSLYAVGFEDDANWTIEGTI
jgi:hypothetical protein